jgi:membrane protease YdiL (CAAX protease family)
MTAALLALALAGYAWFLKGEALLRRWRGAPPARSRIARQHRWIVRAWLWFGALPLGVLALLGRLDLLWRVPAEFAPLTVATRSWLAGPGAPPRSIDLLAATVVAGFAGGAVLGLAIAAWRRRQGRGDLHIGRVGALLPRTRAELGWAAALAITAGVAEELFFRLLLPLLIAQGTGSTPAGFVVATLLFGLAHGYQRLAGVLATTLIGALFAALYLYGGALWLAMLAHALLNLNSLVLRPAFAGAWRH